jgi:hypothetical protein
MMSTDEMEANVLAILEADQDAWFMAMNSQIVEACDDSFDNAVEVCKHLRKMKKVDARGRGNWAQYGFKREVK